MCCSSSWDHLKEDLISGDISILRSDIHVSVGLCSSLFFYENSSKSEVQCNVKKSKDSLDSTAKNMFSGKYI